MYRWALLCLLGSLLVAVEPVLALVATSNATEGGTGRFRITSSVPAPAALTINLTWTGSASNGTDYLNLGAVVLPFDASSVDVNVSTIDDTEGESPETVILQISGGPSAGFTVAGSGTATITVFDNEPVVSVAVTTNAAEPATNGQFTISYPGPALNQPILVNVAFAGTAGSGDFTSPGTSITIPSGANSVIVPIAVLDDVTAEPAETVVLTIEANSGYRIGTGTATLSIADDEPTVSVAVTTNAAEPATNGQFTISYPGPALNQPILVNVAFAGTAGSGDFTSPGTSITIPSGANSVIVPIAVLDDVTAEPAETVVLTIEANSGYRIGTGTATLSIADDDLTVSVVATTAAAEPATSGQFTVSYPAPALSQPVTVNFTLTGSADQNDYNTPIPNQSITIPANALNATVIIPVINDAVAEPTENLTLSIAAGQYRIGTRQATIEIADDEPRLGLTRLVEPSERGVQGSVRCALAGGSLSQDLPFTIEIAGTAGSGTDYQTILTNHTIPAGLSHLDIEVTAIDDAVRDPNETVIVTLVPGLPANYGITPGQATATLTIVDAVPVVSVQSVTAGAEPATAGTVTIGYAGAALPGPNGTGREVTVRYALSGSAAAGIDYANVTGTAVIPSGATSVLVNLTPIDDALIESEEAVVLTLIGQPGYDLGSASVGTVSLRDNDSASPDIINEVDDVALAVGVPWSHQILVRTNEVVGATGLSASLQPAAGSGAPPGWIAIGAPLARSSTEATFLLSGTPPTTGTVRVRIRISDGTSIAVVDLTLQIIGADGHG
jgi:hypothetical protein